MKWRIQTTLGIAILFQLLVLGGMVVNAALPQWTGTEIEVRTVPFDPRSLFRGNYARLRFPFSRVSTLGLPDVTRFRKGEIIYITLVPGNNGVYEFAGASLEHTDNEVVLRGRIDPQFSEPDEVQVTYGIEAWFAPEREAQRLQRDLVNGGIAVLRLSDSGHARLMDVRGR